MIPFKIQILTSTSVHPVTCGYVDKPWLFCGGGWGGSGLNKSTETPKPGVFDPCFTRRCRFKCYSHWRSLCVLHKLAEIATVHLKSLIRCLVLLPPTFAHTLVSSGIYSKGLPSLWINPLGPYLASLVVDLHLEWPGRPSNASTHSLPQSGLQSTHAAAQILSKSSSGQTHHPHLLIRPRSCWVYLFSDMTQDAVSETGRRHHQKPNLQAPWSRTS